LEDHPNEMFRQVVLANTAQASRCAIAHNRDSENRSHVVSPTTTPICEAYLQFGRVLLIYFQSSKHVLHENEIPFSCTA